jgi:rhodanese-related sulfurtransferase
MLAPLLFVALVAAACGSSTSDAEPSDPEPNAAVAEPMAGIRRISAAEGAALQADPPADLVVLDVRTPEEFAEGHLDGAVMIDFYRDDFADQIADLDPDVPYLLYCRSGNRSGQTMNIMRELGFSEVWDVDGGIISWNEAGLPLEN